MIVYTLVQSSIVVCVWRWQENLLHRGKWLGKHILHYVFVLLLLCCICSMSMNTIQGLWCVQYYLFYSFFVQKNTILQTQDYSPKKKNNYTLRCWYDSNSNRYAQVVYNLLYFLWYIKYHSTNTSKIDLWDEEQINTPNKLYFLHSSLGFGMMSSI